MQLLILINLALRFLLELCALAALGYWGFKSGGTIMLKVMLGVGAPLIAAIVWGTFVAPNAAVHLPLAARLPIEVAVFGAAVAAVYFAGHPRVALVFAVVVAVNAVLMYATGS